MDKYNHWLGKLFGKMADETNYAVTIGQTTYYSCSESLVTPRWRRHEDEHKRQWAAEGRIRFLVKYLWYQMKYGYYENPYELDAREAEEMV